MPDLDTIKISSPATGEFWEIPVLFEDEHLLVLNKPSRVLVTADANEPKLASLVQLMHRAIERGAPWAKKRQAEYLMNAHRLDFETSGALVFVKNKSAFEALNEQFNLDTSHRIYAALVRGAPPEETFAADAKLAPHPLQMGIFRIDPKDGKRSSTSFAVRERLGEYALLECKPVPDRPAQIPLHLRHLRLPLVGDSIYGGRPLFLSTLKPDYEPKRDEDERPLIGRAALHLEEIDIDHPATGEKLALKAPWPKDLTASLKYLRRYSAGGFNPTPG